jgi:hypothetical protein
MLLLGMQPAEEFSTLMHEIAHEMLHRGDRRTLTHQTGPRNRLGEAGYQKLKAAIRSSMRQSSTVVDRHGCSRVRSTPVHAADVVRLELQPDHEPEVRRSDRVERPRDGRNRNLPFLLSAL